MIRYETVQTYTDPSHYTATPALAPTFTSAQCRVNTDMSCDDSRRLTIAVCVSQIEIYTLGGFLLLASPSCTMCTLYCPTSFTALGVGYVNISINNVPVPTDGQYSRCAVHAAGLQRSVHRCDQCRGGSGLSFVPELRLFHTDGGMKWDIRHSFRLVAHVVMLLIRANHIFVAVRFDGRIAMDSSAFRSKVIYRSGECIWKDALDDSPILIRYTAFQASLTERTERPTTSCTLPAISP